MSDIFWPIAIRSYAPGHRQFRLDEAITPEQITAAIGVSPSETPDGDKVTLRWLFWAELTYRTPDGGFNSTSIGCKIWDYTGARWSCYGWPEAFESVGLVPLFSKDYGSWKYEEDGNPTLKFLADGLTQSSCEPDTVALDFAPARKLSIRSIIRAAPEWVCGSSRICAPPPPLSRFGAVRQQPSPRLCSRCARP